MSDLSEMTAEKFSELEGDSFTVTSVDPQVEMKLVEIKPLGSGERKGGAFSLLWQGPQAPMLPQATYQVSHSALGTHDLFLVPVAEKEIGYQYEAIFT